MKRHIDYWLGIPFLKVLSWLPRARKTVVQNPKKILIIKLAAFGDSVLLIPTLRAIRQSYPKSKIDWLCSPINAALATTVPYVDETILLQSFAPGNLFKLSKDLHARAYDCVIDFEQWARGTAILAWLSGAPERVGFDTPAQHRTGLFTKTYQKTYEHHERDEFLSLAHVALPLQENSQNHLELWETPKGKTELQNVAPELMAKPNTIHAVLFHPGCGSDGYPREWPIAKYSDLATTLLKDPQTRLYITGGLDEKDLAAALAAKIPKSINLAGRLSWQGVISLLRHVDLVVSGNTGVMHVAAAWKIKQIALHGPTSPQLWGPLNPKAIVISSSCPLCPSLKLGFEYHSTDASCMERIYVPDVAQAAQQLLN